MFASAAEALDRFLARWTAGAAHRAVFVVLAAAVLVAAAAWYASANLGINTSTRDMISEDVPFRQNDLAFDAAFPQFQKQVIVVAEAGTAEQAESLATDLAEAMATRSDRFEEVRVPDVDPFLRRNALLYLSVDDLYDLSDRLAGAQALLAALAADPSLRGLFGVLADGFDAFVEDGTTPPVELAAVLSAMADVVDAQVAGDETLLSWRSVLGGQTLGDGAGRTLIAAQPVLDYGSLAPAGAALREIRALAAELQAEAGSDASVRITGGPALETEELATVTDGAAQAGVISLALVSLLLVLGLRSWRVIVAVLVTLLSGLILSLGFAALTIGSLNLISVAFAVLFIGLAVDFGIHYSLRQREALASGCDRTSALATAAASVGRALSLSALCAAIGFLSFVPTDYRGLAELGIIAGASMVVALLANLTLLPALMTLLRSGGPTVVRHAPASDGLARLMAGGYRVILVAAAVLAVAAAIVVPALRFDVNPLNLQDPDAPAVATYLDLASSSRTTPYRIQILADDLPAAEALAEDIALLDTVDYTLSLASFVPADQDEKLLVIDDLALFLLPVLSPPQPLAAPDAAARREISDRLRSTIADYVASGIGGEAAEQAARLSGALFRLVDRAADPDAALASLEDRLTRLLPVMLDDLSLAMQAEPVGLETIPDRLVRDWLSPQGQARLDVVPVEDVSATEAMRDFADSVQSVYADATGSPVIVTEASRAVARAFLEATIITVLVITAVLAVLFRRLGDVLLALLPLGLTGLYTIAVAVVLGLSFNFANVIVLPLLFALGVSSSIHLVMRRRAEGGAAAALRSSTPRAVLFSALTTVASFGSLAVSAHRGMSSMGILLTIALTITVATTLLVLPALMHWLEQRSAARRSGAQHAGGRP